jgi:DNA-binding protein Fis
MNRIKELKIEVHDLSAMKTKLLADVAKVKGDLADSRSEVEVTDREWVALEAAKKEKRRELRNLEKKKYLIENYFKKVQGYNSGGVYDLQKWLIWAALELTEERVRIIIESVFCAISQEPLRTKMMHALQNQMSNLDAKGRAMQIDQLMELAAPLVQQYIDKEIQEEFERLGHKLRKELGIQEPIKSTNAMDPIGHN